MTALSARPLASLERLSCGNGREGELFVLKKKGEEEKREWRSGLRKYFRNRWRNQNMFSCIILNNNHRIPISLPSHFGWVLKISRLVQTEVDKLEQSDVKLQKIFHNTKVDVAGNLFQEREKAKI